MKLYEIHGLMEGFKNLFNPNEKQQYAKQVFAMVHNAYAYAGGIQANGLDTMEGMIANAPMWKVGSTNGMINSVILYKDKGGRKLVLAATNSTPEGKARLKDMLKNEFQRSYMEVSKDFERFIKKTYPDLVKQYAWSPEQAVAFMKSQGNGVRLIPDNPTHYSRSLNGVDHPKMMIGTPGNSIS